jgi:hypothetical protein
MHRIQIDSQQAAIVEPVQDDAARRRDRRCPGKNYGGGCQKYSLEHGYSPSFNTG